MQRIPIDSARPVLVFAMARLAIALVALLAVVAVGFPYQGRAAAVLAGVAEWVQARAAWTERGVEIRRAMGVAERPEPFDNDAFTNMAAATVLHDASMVASKVGASVPEAWALPAACAILLSSAFGFNREDAKTADHFFTGFPSYWNIVVFYLFVARLPPAVNAAILLVLAAAYCCARWALRGADRFTIEDTRPLASRVDGLQYRVHEGHRDPQQAADALAALNARVVALLRHLRARYIRGAGAAEHREVLDRHLLAQLRGVAFERLVHLGVGHAHPPGEQRIVTVVEVEPLAGNRPQLLDRCRRENGLIRVDAWR